MEIAELKSLIEIVEAGRAAEMRLLELLTDPKRPEARTFSPRRILKPAREPKIMRAVLTALSTSRGSPMTTKQLEAAVPFARRSSISGACSELVRKKLVRRVRIGLFEVI
jgi:hypothetical protein